MKNKKMETSKKILLASYIPAILLTIVVIAGSFTMYDMSNITTIATLAWGEVAVTNAFYYRKAQKENVPKIIANMPNEFKEQIDINQLLNS
jgi:uncharacterized membrane protein